ncbi:MAG: DUF4382 domain-containing protein [Candidatus Aenigmatarchaeota archaeon]|nr:MAG: DUF4382 domain-containing protein [Candidatus Aenigmarchaeota archaeon]
MRAIVAFLFVVAVAGCVGGAGVTSTQGKLLVGITDAAVDSSTVTSVIITVESAEVHSASADSWTTISSSAKTYDLMQLDSQDVVKLFGEATLDAGTYNQMRLDISNVAVTINGTTSDAKLPSSRIEIPVTVVVNANSTSAVVLDFQADQSLHATGNGTVIMAPVIHVKSTSNASASVSGDNVEVSGGRTDDDKEVGMDAEGHVGVGLRIAANAKLNVGANGKISIGA